MVHDNLAYDGMSRSMPVHVLGWHVIFDLAKSTLHIAITSLAIIWL